VIPVLTPAAHSLLEEHSQALAEASSHFDLAAICVGLCLLPAPPGWAIEGRDFVRGLGDDAAREVADLEADAFHVALGLVNAAASERLDLGDLTFGGLADAELVEAAEEMADTLQALAAAVVAVRMERPEPSPLQSWVSAHKGAQAPTAASDGTAVWPDAGPPAPLTPDVVWTLRTYVRDASSSLATPVSSALCLLPGGPAWADGVHVGVQAMGVGSRALVGAYARWRRVLSATLVREASKLVDVVPVLASALVALAQAVDRHPSRGTSS
jgi:hypothetical protein